MRIEETKVYQFDELSDTAKDRARDWFRQGSNDDNYFAESVIEDACRMADMLGISLQTRTVKLMGGGTRQEPVIWWEGFSHQGQGASYSGSYSYRKGSAKAIAKEAPRGADKTYTGNNLLNDVAEMLAEVQARNFYQLQASITASRGHYLSIDVERADDKPVSTEDEDTVIEALRDFANWIYRQLEAEYEYQNADEQVDENIRANEYEFTEEGYWT